MFESTDDGGGIMKDSAQRDSPCDVSQCLMQVRGASIGIKKRSHRGSNTGPYDLQSYALPLSYKTFATFWLIVYMYTTLHSRTWLLRVIETFIKYTVCYRRVQSNIVT